MIRGSRQNISQKKLKAELNAKVIEAFRGTVREYGDDGKVVSSHEEVIYSKRMVAWDIRQRARQDAHKLRGDYPAEEHKIGGNGRPIEHTHKLDPGGALQAVIERLVGATSGPPSNGHTE